LGLDKLNDNLNLTCVSSLVVFVGSCISVSGVAPQYGFTKALDVVAG